jgi:carbon-monoxide dehydrogenase medium subunit
VPPGYARPSTLAEATALAAEPGSVLMAGGTDVLVWLKDGSCPVDRLVSLRDVADLAGMRRESDGRWFLGAMTTHAWAAADPALGGVFPALAEACRTVGSPAVRSSATIGGNVCTAAPSADSAGPLLAYGAEVALAGRAGRREIPLTAFFLGPGRTALLQGEVVVGFGLPDPGPHGASFRKLSRRRAMDIAIVSACALVGVGPGGCCTDLRLALGAVAPTPLLVEGTADLALGRRCDTGLLDDLTRAATNACRPISDIRASSDYRREMVGALTRAVVLEAWQQAETAPGAAGAGGAS